MEQNIQKSWVLEFLLRQPVEDQIVSHFISALPLSSLDHHLRKTLLLRNISSKIQKGLISEKILESLELIEEIDYQKGIKISQSMKDAYYTVAVDCTVKFLKEDPKNFSEYNNVIGRIWRSRVLDMERGKEIHLVLDWSKELRGVLEKAVHDVSACDYIIMEDTRNDALEAVGLFLRQVTEEMGPSFLEFTAGEVGEDVEDEVEMGQMDSTEDPGTGLDEHNRNVAEINCSDIDADTSVDGPQVRTNASVDDQGGVRQPVTINALLDDHVGVRQPETMNEKFDEVQVPFSASVDDQVRVIEAETIHEKVDEVMVSNNASMDVQVGVGQPETMNEKVDEVRIPTNASLDDHIGVRQPETSNEKVDEGQVSTKASIYDQAVVRQTSSLDPLGDLEEYHDTISGDTYFQINANCDVESSDVRSKKSYPVPTPDVREVREALKSSILDLNDMVEDPLPDALCTAATIIADMAKEGVSNVQSAENENEVDISDRSVDSGCEAVQDKEGNYRNLTAASRPSLMERNSTAHTVEWDNESESSSEEPRNRPHLPSPKSRIVSPLRREEIRNNTGRRKRKKWSSLEEQTLIDAVQEYGRGKWKCILDNYHEIFENRNEVDLKDKWRNLTK
ncbi:hypothetical protein AQUCO_04500237v1 [Aquilegia coerulea]|uniref:Uncharacterized protein n=1 Tax=Aquilegia coerulea TaxID=218851 RepID=A0A2G5CMG1_AQUCA|nr:hypothetical protein AQUCO_04500237v1 [Aquilegia coerulea]PIA32485.1 hypothetical protein AQUCO_04500237v1 [Aquilegia coerulea]